MLQKRQMLSPVLGDLVERCQRAAKRRTQENLQKSWYKNTKKSHEPQEVIELRGLMCEVSMALSLELSIEPIFKTGNRSATAGTDLGDLFYDGVHMDIKGVRYQHSNLLISVKKRHTCIDVYVLVHEDKTWGNRFLGAIPYHKAFGQKIVLADGTDLGNGVPQDQLLDLDTAIAQAKEEREKERLLLAR